MEPRKVKVCHTLPSKRQNLSSSLLTHLCRMDFYNNTLDRYISNKKWCLLFYNHVLQNFLYLIQTVQTLIRRRRTRRLIWVYTVCQYPFYGTAASDLGLHCLPISLLWAARHKWVKSVYTSGGRAVEIPCPTCATCPISLRTSKKFQFNVFFVSKSNLYRF